MWLVDFHLLDNIDEILTIVSPTQMKIWLQQNGSLFSLGYFLSISIISMSYLTTIVPRSQEIGTYFSLISLLFSDELLSFDYVYKSLIEWQSDTNYCFIMVTENNSDIISILRNIYSKLNEDTIVKLNSLIPTYVQQKKIERIVCYYCKNYGSVIAGRDPSITSVRFICENCENKSTDNISDLVWARRCGEISQNQSRTHITLTANLRKDIFDIINNKEDSFYLRSIMIVYHIKEIDLTKLLCLFTIKSYRGNGIGKHLIETIPQTINNLTSMLSICTAGLDSTSLFSKY